MKRPFPAYKGDQPFIFISYSHRDSSVVFKEITWLREQGFNIWYDEGIEVGREWRQEIADAISGASALLFFVTPDATASENCRNEVNFAADEQTPIITVYLKPTELPGGLRLTLSNRQAIHRFDLARSVYRNKLVSSLAEQTGNTFPGIAKPTDQKKWPRLTAIIGVLMLLALGLLVTFLKSPEPVSGEAAARVVPETRLRSIAVLPFQNLNQDPQFDAVADGVALDLTTGLAKIHDIRVAAATSSFVFKNQYDDVSAIGKRLKVDTVLEGSVRVIDDVARVNVQLLLVEDGYQLWSESYDRPFGNVLDFQDLVTAEILNSVRLHLIDKAAVDAGEVTLGAYNLYLVARDNMRARTEDSLLLAKAQFEESLRLDPEYGAAWADLARAVILLSDLQYGETPFIEAKAEAEAHLERAFSLEPNLASGYATKGFLHLNEGHQMEALANFHRAIALDPNNAYAHFQIAEIMENSGNFNAALASLELAYELDTRHPIIQYRLVMYYLAQKDFEGVRNSVRPDQTLLADALIDFRMGREAEGVKKANQYLQLEESGFAGVHLRIELARRYYYRLKNIDLAQQTISESDAFAGRIYFQALEYPEVAYQLLRQVPESYQSRFTRYLLARSQILTGRFEECLKTLEYESAATMPIQGGIYLGLPGDQLTLAFYAAFSLSKLGRSDEAMQLQAELLRYHQLAIEQGEPPGYFRHLARLELLAGNSEKAIRLLGDAHANQALDWSDLANPWYDALREMPEFQMIQQAVIDHMNEQRRALGWSEVSITNL